MKFGLIIPDSKKKQTTPTNTTTNTNTNISNNNSNKVASIFNEADDSEEEELADLRKRKSRAALTTSISSSDQFVSKLHEEALNEDPNVFDYDVAIETETANSKNSHRNNRFFSAMSNKPEKVVEEESKGPKYMHNILAKAEERKIESELIKLRNMKRQAGSKADGENGEEEVFVTSAYRQRLQELEEKEKELKERQKNEEDGDVTKRKDMSGFYYNLMKRNVSFGGNRSEVKRVKSEISATEKYNAGSKDGGVEVKDDKTSDKPENIVTSDNDDKVESSSDEAVVFGPRRPSIKK